MSRVIKNNDGVAIVEGTPAASLVKDVNKFFAAKPPERMAGESVSQPRKLDPRAINTRRPTPRDLEQMNNPPVENPAIRSGRRPAESEVVLDTFMGRRAAEPEVVLDTFMGNRKKEPKLVSRDLSAERDQQSREAPPGFMTNLQESERSLEREEAEAARRALATNVKEKPPQETEPKRQEALDKTREFKRQRAAERSADEQERTKGKFISTLRR